MAVRSEDERALLAKSRQIKEKFKNDIDIRIALQSNNDVVDAQILLGFCIAESQITKFDTVILHDFPSK